jgi:hypothetical protein
LRSTTRSEPRRRNVALRAAATAHRKMWLAVSGLSLLRWPSAGLGRLRQLVLVATWSWHCTVCNGRHASPSGAVAGEKIPAKGQRGARKVVPNTLVQETARPSGAGGRSRREGDEIRSRGRAGGDGGRRLDCGGGHADGAVVEVSVSETVTVCVACRSRGPFPSPAPRRASSVWSLHEHVALAARRSVVVLAVTFRVLSGRLLGGH